MCFWCYSAVEGFVESQKLKSPLARTTQKRRGKQRKKERKKRKKEKMAEVSGAGGQGVWHEKKKQWQEKRSNGKRREALTDQKEAKEAKEAEAERKDASCGVWYSRTIVVDR
jgi:hypothetical protein